MGALLAAPDKFRGTLSAPAVCRAIGEGAGPLGWTVVDMPLSDGGEGFLDAFDGLGGAHQTLEVEGPLGEPVVAEWIQVGRTAVIEMARASGLVLAGGAGGNDPWRADTRGTGALMVEAARAVIGGPPARDLPTAARGPGERPTVIVGLGGSATTDGGRGALDVIEEAGGLGDVDLIGACDVSVGFLEAARRFGPQKGADPGQVAALEDRLGRVAERYRRDYGVDVLTAPGTGAAGGFGGALVALGGSLRSGYAVVTETLGFAEALRTSGVVVTGEGSFDATSLLGKVVGSVVGDGSALGVPVLIIAGRADDDAVREAEAAGAHVVSLTARFGEERAMADTAACIAHAVGEGLAVVAPAGPGSGRSPVDGP